MTLRIPEPNVSANRVTRHNRKGQIYLNPEARSYKSAVRTVVDHLLRFYPRPIFMRPNKSLTVAVAWFASHRGDVDNIAKTALDALKGIVYASDAMIRSYLVDYHVNAASRLQGWLEITVRRAP